MRGIRTALVVVTVQGLGLVVRSSTELRSTLSCRHRTDIEQRRTDIKEKERSTCRRFVFYDWTILDIYIKDWDLSDL